jgi:hypothetical protein
VQVVRVAASFPDVYDPDGQVEQDWALAPLYFLSLLHVEQVSLSQPVYLPAAHVEQAVSAFEMAGDIFPAGQRVSTLPPVQ